MKTQYDLSDFSGAFWWVRLPNGAYLVDHRYEADFLAHASKKRAKCSRCTLLERESFPKSE